MLEAPVSSYGEGTSPAPVGNETPPKLISSIPVPELTFLGAARTVTGSKYLLTHGKSAVLFDCGLFQGLKELRLRNWEDLPVPASSINAVVLTHAHLDHVGYVPRLVKQGFKGPVFCTSGTAELSQLVLPDSGRIQEEDARQANRHGYSKHSPAMPLYDEADAHRALTHFHPVSFRLCMTKRTRTARSRISTR